MNESLFSQFLLTYGTMMAILILLIIIRCGSVPVNTTTTVTASTATNGGMHMEIWSLIINAFTPTTITFVASLIFEEAKLKNNKMVSSILLLFVICMALIYMTFEAVSIQAIQKFAVDILGVLSLLIPGISLCLLFFATSNNDPNFNSKAIPTSDGDIFSRRQ